MPTLDQSEKSGEKSGLQAAVPPLVRGDKERYIREMFAAIAPQYDRLNSLLSFRQHYAWRRKAVRLAEVRAGELCLDVCTGTGDFALDLASAVGPSGKVIASDFCEPMVRNGLSKLRTAAAPAIMMTANAEQLPYPSAAFDVVTVGFGIRNVAHIDRAVQEMARVTRPGGRVVILEFNRPQPSPLKPLIDLYLFRILPGIGGLFSRKEAYTYLPESMRYFVSREELAQSMHRAGLTNIRIVNLNFGTVCIHLGTRLPAGNGNAAQ